MSIGHCLEAAERYEGAIDAFRACIDAEGSEPFRAECELGIARCLEGLGKMEEAKAAYERIEEKDEGTYWGRWAEQRLAYLECRREKDSGEPGGQGAQGEAKAKEEPQQPQQGMPELVLEMPPAEIPKEVPESTQ